MQAGGVHMVLRASDHLIHAKPSQLSWQSSSEIAYSPASYSCCVFVISHTTSRCCHGQEGAEILDLRNTVHTSQSFFNSLCLLEQCWSFAEHTLSSTLIKTNEKRGPLYGPLWVSLTEHTIYCIFRVMLVSLQKKHIVPMSCTGVLLQVCQSINPFVLMNVSHTSFADVFLIFFTKITNIFHLISSVHNYNFLTILTGKSDDCHLGMMRKIHAFAFHL